MKSIAFELKPTSGRGRLGLALLLPAVLALSHLTNAAAASFPATPADLFEITKVWTVHLRFTSENWKAMEPERGGAGPFGGFGGRGGNPPGPSMFAAPAFLRGDQDGDGKLARAELQRLGEKWFAEWDKDQLGKLNADHLRAGLSAVMAPPEFGPGGRGGGGPGPGMIPLQGGEGQRNGLASMMGVEFKDVRADLEFEGKPFKDISVRYKGNGTWMQSQGSIKHSLKVDLNDFTKGQQLAGVTKLNLHNCVTDASWMNEVLSHRLFRDAGVPAPRTAYARVYVTVPGEHDRAYFGLYSLVENIDDSFAEERFDSKKGAIFKPVTPSPFTDLGDNWAAYQQTYDPKTGVSKKEERRMIELAKLVSHGSDAEFAAKFGDYVDLDQFARFMAVTVWLPTLDSILSIGQNYYVYLHPKTDKLQFIPWDLDHSFGQFPLMSTQEGRENLSIHQPWRGGVEFLERAFRIESFKKLYLAKMAEFSGTIFKPERIHTQVDEIAAAIRPAVAEESDTVLARFERVVAGETVEPAGFGGFGGRRGGGRGFGESTPPGGMPFFPSVKPIKPFVTARARAVGDQLAGKSQGQTLESGFGMFGGGPGGRRNGLGGPGDGPRGRGPGGPGAFGPGMMLATPFMRLDSNKDGWIARDEFTSGLANWFESWNTDKSGFLSDQQLRAGIDKDLSPELPFGRRGGFGPP